MKLLRAAAITAVGVYVALLGVAAVLDINDWFDSDYLYGMAAGWFCGCAIMHALLSSAIRTLIRSQDVVVFNMRRPED
jgi:hypothetical protein